MAISCEVDDFLFQGEELEDLTHLAKADVLLAAPSGFSMAAAFFNSKCFLAHEPLAASLA